MSAAEAVAELKERIETKTFDGVTVSKMMMARQLISGMERGAKRKRLEAELAALNEVIQETFRNNVVNTRSDTTSQEQSIPKKVVKNEPVSSKEAGKKAGRKTDQKKGEKSEKAANSLPKEVILPEHNIVDKDGNFRFRIDNLPLPNSPAKVQRSISPTPVAANAVIMEKSLQNVMRRAGERSPIRKSKPPARRDLEEVINYIQPPAKEDHDNDAVVQKGGDNNNSGGGSSGSSGSDAVLISMQKEEIRQLKVELAQCRKWLAREKALNDPKLLEEELREKPGATITELTHELARVKRMKEHAVGECAALRQECAEGKASWQAMAEECGRLRAKNKELSASIARFGLGDSEGGLPLYETMKTPAPSTAKKHHSFKSAARAVQAHRNLISKSGAAIPDVTSSPTNTLTVSERESKQYVPLIQLELATARYQRLEEALKLTLEEMGVKETKWQRQQALLRGQAATELRAWQQRLKEEVAQWKEKYQSELAARNDLIALLIQQEEGSEDCSLQAKALRQKEHDDLVQSAQAAQDQCGLKQVELDEALQDVRRAQEATDGWRIKAESLEKEMELLNENFASLKRFEQSMLDA